MTKPRKKVKLPAENDKPFKDSTRPGLGASRAIKGSLESAANDTAGSARTTPGHDASLVERGIRISEEEARLREWAERNGKLKGYLPPVDARGGEHTVHFDQKTNRHVKATRPEAFAGYGIALGSHTKSATPGEYLDRLTLQNKVFGDDIRIERIVDSAGRLSIVTAQPSIKGRDATEPEIDHYVAMKGYVKIAPGAFHDENEVLLVHDMHGRNVKVDTNNIIHPIDPVIQRVQPDFVLFIQRNPHLM